jgi:hypothetical protein
MERSDHREVMTDYVIMCDMVVETEHDDSRFHRDWEGQGELVESQDCPACSRSFSMCVMKLVVRQFIMNFKLIWFNMCGIVAEIT